MTGNITIFRAEWRALCGRIAFRQNFSPSRTYILSISDCMTLTEIVDDDWRAAWESVAVMRALPQMRVLHEKVLEIIRQGDTAMWDWGRFMYTWAAWSDGYDARRKEERSDE